MYMFRFENFSMETDDIDTKGKVTNYRQINVCSDNEENARIKAFRPKIDLDTYKLSEGWELFNVFKLGKDWG